MLIYQTYIIRSILLPLLVITFVITSIVWITQILKLLYLIERGISLVDFVSVIILTIPALLFIVLPFVTVLAVIYSYNRLREERQLIILKNSGLNPLQLASPALLVAFLVTIFSYYISFELLPLSYIKLKSDLSFAKNNYASNIITGKTFNQISNDIVVYVDKKSEDGLMRGIVLFDNRNTENRIILFAEYGKLSVYNDNPVFSLYNGLRQVYDVNHQLTKLHFDSLLVEIISNKTQKSEQSVNNKDINEYYIDELLKPSNLLPEARKIKLIAEGHQRLIWPLYNFILAFLGLSVFLKQPYDKKSHFKQILVSAFAVVIVTYCHFTLHNLASRNLDFIFACYMNLIIGIIFSLFLSLRKRL